MWERLKTCVTFTLKLIVGMALLRWALDAIFQIRITIPFIDPLLATVGRWIVGTLNALLPR